MKSIILIIVMLILCNTTSYKILVCYPLNVKSMSILGEAVVRHLLNDGHEVTFITTHPLERQKSKNFRQIHISNNNIFNDQKYSIKEVLQYNIEDNDVQSVQEFARETARLTFQNENVTAFLEKTDEQFDVVIVDLLESEVYAGLAVLYRCPMIWIYSMGAHWQALRLIADPTSPAYDTNYIGAEIPPYNFSQRMKELMIRIKWTFYKTFVTTPIERDIYKQVFEPLLTKRGRTLPDYEEVLYNASFIFGNENNAIYYRPSTPQNFKYIGGFHIEDPVKPLPMDLQNLMDTATHGVIYFSLGSFWKSKELPTAMSTALVNIFGELKQTVLWKYEDDLSNLPKNLHLVRWAPQQSILAHPKCKIFITHGGLLSTTESIHFGVPIIGIPVLNDQFLNVNKASDSGYGIRVDFNNDLPRNLKVAISTMLNHERYYKKAKEVSSIYHDIPTKPGEELVHWVRHVVRTDGAPHLRSPAIKVPLYQLLYLDLIALLCVLCSIFAYVLNIVMKNNYKNITPKKKL